MVHWSSRPLDAETHDTVYELNLADRVSRALVTTSGNQTSPIVLGDSLLWQSDANGRSRIVTTSLSAARATASVASPQAPHPDPTQASLASSAESLSGTVLNPSSYTRPTYKGMHVANGGGWDVTYNGIQQPCNDAACPAVDALGAPFEPFFGSLLVIDYDLTHPTGRSAPWGPTVADALQYLQNNYGTRVVVRLWPTQYPKPNGSTNPSDVVNKIIGLAQSYSWIQNVQVDNEPNLPEGWPDFNSNPANGCDANSGTYCTWANSGQTRMVQWHDLFDSRKYDAINTSIATCGGT